MHTRRFIWILLSGGLAASLVFMAVRQSRANDALRGEAEALRTIVQNLNTERAGREALFKLEPKPGEVKEWTTDPTEADRLREEIARLKTEIAGLPTRPPAKETKAGSVSYTQMEHILDTARRGRTQELADLITLDPDDQKEAESLYTQLPEGMRGQYANTQHLAAAVVALALIPPDTSGAVVTKGPVSKDKKTVTFHLEPRGIPPASNPPPLDCVFRRQKGDKWLLVVSPAMMESYRQAVTEALKKK